MPRGFPLQEREAAEAARDALDDGPTRKIVSIKQSPLNPERWCCDLNCGHDGWITAKHKPTRKFLCCARCAGSGSERE